MAAILNVETASQGQGSPVVPAQSRPRCLTTIPLDILLLVRDCLPVASRIALALTCKSFSTSLYPIYELPIPAREDLVDLLLLLEKDSPSYFICFDCRRLRLFDPRPNLGWRRHHDHVCGDRIERIWHSITHKPCARWGPRTYPVRHVEIIGPFPGVLRPKAPRSPFQKRTWL